MIEKKCENCGSKYLCESYESDTGRPICGNFNLFIAKEELIRKDEREKIKDFIISRGEMNEKQILKELYEYLD